MWLIKLGLDLSMLFINRLGRSYAATDKASSPSFTELWGPTQSQAKQKL